LQDALNGQTAIIMEKIQAIFLLALAIGGPILIAYLIYRPLFRIKREAEKRWRDSNF